MECQVQTLSHFLNFRKAVIPLGYIEKPQLRDYIMRYHKPSSVTFLMHYGIKGMRWGVRRTPEELAKAKLAVEKTDKTGIIRTVIFGHSDAPKNSTPNSVVDHIDNDGKVIKRSYYNAKGEKVRDIHTTDHGNRKRHQFGTHGEHAHDYQWDANGQIESNISRELTDDERKENEDIL